MTLEAPPQFQWDLVTELHIEGEPKGQPRARVFIHKKTGRPVAWNTNIADDWKARIVQEAEKHLPPEPLSGPVRVDCLFLLPRPKYLMRARDFEGPVPCPSRPDRDNLDKCILDSLGQIRFFGNDAQVFFGVLEKYFHGKTGRPGAIIKIATPKLLLVAGIAKPAAAGSLQETFL